MVFRRDCPRRSEEEVGMKASRNGQRPCYTPPFSRRKDFCRKVRETEKQIQRCKDEGAWKKASHLQWVLRNVWWGYKRYQYEN